MNGRRVLLGRVVGVHGVRGAVRIESFTDPRSAIFNYKPWRLTGQLQGRDEVEVDHATPVSVHARTKSILAMLPGIEDRDAAAAWIGADISIARQALPEPKPGEVYQADLEGLRVCNTAGEDLGCVSYLFDNGAHDVLCTRDDAGRERLIPYVFGRYVESVDLAAGCITVDWEKDD